ncbi:chemotaxis protein CheB [Chitinophaga lutea]
MINRDIIVIGASAGGFEALKRLVAGLPPDLPAAVFIVWHMPPEAEGVLSRSLDAISPLRTANAVNREPVRKGRIYVAPPDLHLLLERDEIRLSRGPKENLFRPAIDPLFRSAAQAFGPRVIGVVMTGALDDGVAGLWTIKQYGGTAVVQLPADAEIRSMPENAIREVEVDHIAAADDIGPLLGRLASEPPSGAPVASRADRERTRLETAIALEARIPKKNSLHFGDISPFTCPECHGVLVGLQEGGRTRYRCHTGHAFTAASLLAGIHRYSEDVLWNAIRTIRENMMLLNHMGDHFAEINQPRLAAQYFRSAKDAELQSEKLQAMLKEWEALRTGNPAPEQQPENNLPA